MITNNLLLLNLLGYFDRTKAEISIEPTLSGNIEDVDSLRRGYDRLTRSEDQVQFLRHLYQNYRTQDQRRMVVAIAGESDDPDIRRIVSKDLTPSG